MSHVMGFVKLIKRAPTVLPFSSLRHGKKSLVASHDDVITQFGHYENWLQSLALVLGALKLWI